MPCNMMFRRELLPEKLAEQGWDNDEIQLLEMEIELAIQKAKKASFERGDTLAQQKAAMYEADKAARKVAHERMHAKLDTMMDDIRSMGDAKKIPVEDKVH
jgi:hypothetical protein